MGAPPNPSKLGCFSMKSGWFLGIPPRPPMSNISIHHLASEGKNTRLLKLSLRGARDGPKTMGKNYACFSELIKTLSKTL